MSSTQAKRLKSAIRSRDDRAKALRTLYDGAVAEHVIRTRHVIDEGRAVFEVGQPGNSCYWAQIACLSYGTVLVHGDVDAVIFGCCSYKTWQGKLSWMSGHNYSYAEEKASIGSTCSEMARVMDNDIAIGDLLHWRRHGYIDKDDAADVYHCLVNDDIHEAQNLIWERTHDHELRLGPCTAPRVFLAQALITRLCDLLRAEGTDEFWK